MDLNYTDDQQAFRAEVRTYLVENPEVLVEAIEVLVALHEELGDDVIHLGHGRVGARGGGRSDLTERRVQHRPLSRSPASG